jgi:copper resistance protein D
VTALLAATRAIHFASLMALFGGSAYGSLLRRAGLSEPPLKPERALFTIAASLALVSGIIWFCLIAGQMSGDWRGSMDPGTLQLAASATRFGQIFLGRFVGLVALWFFCIVRTKPHGLGFSVLAGFLLALLAPISHAAAAGGDIAIMGAASDAAHLLTAGFWVGGLMILATLVPRSGGNPRTLLGPLRLFSIWGSFVVALLVLTGLINAISVLPASAMSFRNAYFDLLSVKVGLALAMVALAALNRWQLAPALRNGGSRAVGHLAASISAEVALGLTIVGIAGYLGVTAPH